MMVLLLVSCGGDLIAPTPRDSGDSEGSSLEILSLDPAEGLASGGTFVRIEGHGFTSASTASVAGVPCAELTFLSSGELFCTTPPGSPGPADLTVTSADLGASATFTYLADEVDTGDTADTGPTTVTSCALTSSSNLSVPSGDLSEAITGTVVVAGRTEGDNEAPGVEGAVGFGAAGADPSAWTWNEMTYVGSDGAGDSYSGYLDVSAVDTYAFSVRFRVDHGEWTVCTASDGSYGVLDVTVPVEEVAVDYCHLQWPCDMTAAAGAAGPDVYGWIYQGGVSNYVGQGLGIQMEVGIGDAGTSPLDDLSWSWSSMAYNADKDGLMSGDVANDEYVGHFTAPATPGTYDYVVRASADYGLSWTLCDLGGDSCNEGGSSDGYDNPGVCTVE